jgi:peptide-methionine (R)-S-oxide reductase
VKSDGGWRKGAFVVGGAMLMVLVAASRIPVKSVAHRHPRPRPASVNTMPPQITKSDQEWREQLTAEQYRVLREKGTERAFTGQYWNHQEAGDYQCAGCGARLFGSSAKFDSGCGWPSFFAPATTNAVAEAPDHSHGMMRIEVLCARCGGHLGHVFEDGPQPTGLRYCINSAALKFSKKP